MPRASAGRAGRIVIALISAILPGFVHGGESDPRGIARPQVKDFAGDAMRCRVASKRQPRYGAGMRADQSLRFSLVVGLLFSISAAGHTESPKTPGKPAPSLSGTPSERLGTVDAWTAYDYTDKSGKVCYLAGEPIKSEPAGGKRKRPLAMVTHRPGEKVANVVSFVEGRPLKEGSEVSLDIGGAKFDLFTKGDSAWARTAELDKAIVEAMAKGKQAIVKGTPQKGRTVTDTYSLVGFAQALVLIDKACDVKR
jgi:Invasion associated locus B (IalB) protein